jgi:uncharacterized protein YvpB
MSKISDFLKSVFGQKKAISVFVPKYHEPNIKKINSQEVKQEINSSEDVNPFEFITTKNKKPKANLKKATKTHKVRLHLLNRGSIDSWTAIELYGATRLSSIIFNLKNRGMDITSIPSSALDKNSNVSNYTTYKLNK